MLKWYEKSGEHADVVLSSRVRLARNLKDFPFAGKLQKEDIEKINTLVCEALFSASAAVAEKFKKIDMQKLSQLEAISLVERHLVSPEFISRREGKLLLISDDEAISIMLGEEDHIRLQVMQEGCGLDEIYELADKIDTLLDERLNIAFDEQLGYLTQCPTNLGTGMRASLLLHLPALQESGSINRIAASLSKLGLIIRGTYGEGSSPKGSLYQLSNQVTLGLSEKEAIRNLKDIAMQLISQERSARKAMAKHTETLDLIGRSLGILLYAKVLSCDEFMRLISNVRLGISLGVCENISYDTVNRLIIDAQSATLSRNAGENLSAQQRDQVRAALVSKRLSNL